MIASNLIIEHMTPAHKTQVIEIENSCHEYPWSWEDFLGLAGNTNSWIYVAKIKHRVVGYIAVMRHEADEITEIVSIAVSPDLHRLGIGTNMIRFAEELLDLFTGKAHGLHTLKAIVRERNLNAQLFLKDVGFRATEILHNMYKESDEDAYVFINNSNI